MACRSPAGRRLRSRRRFCRVATGSPGRPCRSADGGPVPSTGLRILGVEADYAAAGRLENDLRSAGVQVLGTDYGDSAATLRVALNDDATILTGFNDRLATLTAGASHAEDLGTEWVDVR